MSLLGLPRATQDVDVFHVDILTRMGEAFRCAERWDEENFLRHQERLGGRRGR